MKQITKKWVRYVHFSTLPLLILVTVSIIVIQWSPPVYIADNCACPTNNGFQNISVFINFAVAYYVTATLIFHVVFVFSFVYPLYLHKKSMPPGGLNQDNYIMPIMNRAAVVGGVLVLLELVIGIVFFTVILPSSSRGFHILASSDLLIKVFAMIMSFSDWQEKLFPYKLKRGAD